MSFRFGIRHGGIELVHDSADQHGYVRGDLRRGGIEGQSGDGLAIDGGTPHDSRQAEWLAGFRAAAIAWPWRACRRRSVGKPALRGSSTICDLLEPQFGHDACAELGGHLRLSWPATAIRFARRPCGTGPWRRACSSACLLCSRRPIGRRSGRCRGRRRSWRCCRAPIRARRQGRACRRWRTPRTASRSPPGSSSRAPRAGDSR